VRWALAHAAEIVGSAHDAGRNEIPRCGSPLHPQ
jgi:hypothetical protein